MKTNPKIAIVLLNYNSNKDLFVSYKQLGQQKGVNIVTIVVDNASKPEVVKELQEWVVQQKDTRLLSVSTDELADLTAKQALETDAYDTFVVYNSENKGYSAGNNIGMRLADALGADAVLIANPDMRFEDDTYVAKLAETLFSDEQYLIAASKIVGLEGENQSPLREASCFEELTWPRHMFPKIFKNSSFVLPYDKEKVTTVHKVSGCCLMLRMEFLKNIDYLDEATFLYAEEPILSAQVKQQGGQIAFDPSIKAIHAHIKREKGNNSKRMLLFIKSRRYYLKQYSGYNFLQMGLLELSYALLYIMHFLKSKIGNNR